MIGLIILTIACASTVTLAIRNTANTIVKSYEESHDLTATISFDRGQLGKNFKGGEDAPKDSYVFKNINYDFEEGKMYTIKGKSGSGKTKSFRVNEKPKLLLQMNLQVIWIKIQKMRLKLCKIYYII